MNPSLHTGQAGHGRGRFLGKDSSCDSTLVFYMNYVSMNTGVVVENFHQLQFRNLSKNCRALFKIYTRCLLRSTVCKSCKLA